MVAVNPQRKIIFMNDNKVIGCKCESNNEKFIYCLFDEPLNIEEYNNQEIRHNHNKKIQLGLTKTQLHILFRMLVCDNPTIGTRSKRKKRKMIKQIL